MDRKLLRDSAFFTNALSKYSSFWINSLQMRRVHQHLVPTLEHMRSPAQHKAYMLQARQHASALLAKTSSAQVVHLSEVDEFPPSFQPHWQAFIRIDHPTGEIWQTHRNGPSRNPWMTAILISHSFPLRATLFLLPVAVELDITHPNWLLELYEQCRPFDVVLALEGGDVIAFSDDEDGLRRLIVPWEAQSEGTTSD